jgi:hypothetical protein
MTTQTFSLIPFSRTNIPAIQITGQVGRQNGHLNLQYVLTGDVDKILLPERSAAPQRKHELWSTTCFELFLARPVEPQYWEFNLSPSGDWNIYRMDAYRRVGFREETSIQRLQFEVRKESGNVLMNTNVDLSPFIAAGQKLELGICCVIQSIGQHESYWALAHPQSDPDFHLRDSFILQM